MELSIEHEPKPDYSKAIPKQVDRKAAEHLEEQWLLAQTKPELLFLLKGENRQEQLETIRDWAQLHEPRITVRQYSHPNPNPETIYFTLRLYRRRGSY